MKVVSNFGSSETLRLRVFKNDLGLKREPPFFNASGIRGLENDEVHPTDTFKHEFKCEVHDNTINVASCQNIL